MQDLFFDFGGADGFFGNHNGISFEQIAILWDVFLYPAGMNQGDGDEGP